MGCWDGVLGWGVGMGCWDGALGWGVGMGCWDGALGRRYVWSVMKLQVWHKPLPHLNLKSPHNTLYIECDGIVNTLYIEYDGIVNTLYIEYDGIVNTLYIELYT